ncbi:MAG: imidazole glycerol phosphate synthase subunit HisH [Gammaproteobacteria bacterium]|nr:imidazole glycerol phosphate synthase subunit HisH [Gammaproteobacteria bacterium]
MKVTVVDYGIGNILSVQRAFMHNGAEVSFASSAAEIMQAERLVVPGVGAFKHCMETLEEFDLKTALIEYASTGRPYLGICVGMQMLMDNSFEFGEYPGLALIPGEVRKIDVPGERIPFIGWKSVDLMGSSHHYYFVHSYQAMPRNKQNLWASYSLGDSEITAAIRKDNVIGVQFHPEKSGEDGLDFINNFLQI